MVCKIFKKRIQPWPHCINLQNVQNRQDQNKSSSLAKNKKNIFGVFQNRPTARPVCKISKKKESTLATLYKFSTNRPKNGGFSDRPLMPTIRFNCSLMVKIKLRDGDGTVLQISKNIFFILCQTRQFVLIL
jgi:hypothetical protein